MRRKTIQAAVALALAAPAAAFAQHFEAVDTIPWPYLGRFPAYAVEPLRPTEIWVQGGLLHDNNVFRFSKDANVRALTGHDERADTIARLGAGIRHEQRVFGRQRVRLEARGEQFSFQENSLLDHFAYGLRGEWLWEFTNDLSGTLGYERRRRLVDMAQLQRPVKDLVIEQHAFATAAYMLGPSVRLRGALDGTKGEHSDTGREAANARVDSVIGGIDYVTTLGNALGIEARRSQGNFPTQELVGGTTLVDNEFTEKEVAGVATYTTGPQVRATVRVGRTTRNHKQFPQRDFTGTTWRTTVDWMPLQKTGFEFALYREPRTIVDLAASYVVISGFSFGPRWAPTEKLVFSAMFLRERQAFGGDPGTVVLGAPQRDEVVRTFRLGAGWEPQRFLELSLGFEKGQRTSNVFLRDFDYTMVMANARWRY